MMRAIGLFSPFRRVRGVFYGWWMSVLAAVILGLSIVPLFQGMAIWNPVMRGRFGWTPDQLTWAFAFTRIEGGILGPLEGYLVQRLGSRRMVLIGLLILGTGFLLFSRIHDLWQLYVVFILMSLGVALGTWLPMMTVLNHWFVRQRSRAMGLAMEGWAIGGIVILPLMAWAIGGIEGDQPERFGWRATAATIGVILVLMAIPASRLVRNRPEDYGYLPDGDSPAPSVEKIAPIPASLPVAGEGGMTWQEALRTKTFWLISIGHGASTIIPVAATVHLGLILDDRGISLQTVGWVVAAITAVNAIFIMVGGYIGDRVPIRYAVFWFSSFQSVAVLILVLGKSIPMAFLFAVVLGISSGGRIPLTTAIRGVYFGRRGFAAITGISMVPLNVLLFAAPLFAGYMYRFTGSYTTAFIVIAIVSFLGSVLFLLLEDPNPLVESSTITVKPA